MNKITRKRYNIAKNTFVGKEADILAYSIDCKYIHSMKQCRKRYYRYTKTIKNKGELI